MRNASSAIRRLKVMISVLLAVLVCLPHGALIVSAANVSTVASIPQDITAALDYADNNVGLNSGEYTIPGLMQTVTRNSAGDTVQLCAGMVPQGMCFADSGNYLLISAYCNCGSGHRSVIYVINASTKEYETTLILDNSAHVGGIAAYGSYIWVCDTASGKYLRSYKLSSMKDALTHNYWTVYTQSQPAVATSPSFLCCANGYLYLGTFYESTTTCVIYYYSISGTSISKSGSFTVTGIPKIQGISVRGEYMVLSCSYGRKNASDVYIFHDATNQFKKSGVTYAKANARHYSFPNMVEACYIGSTYTYFLFESGAKTYRESANTRPLDKYLRFKSTALFAGTLDKPIPEPDPVEPPPEESTPDVTPDPVVPAVPTDITAANARIKKCSDGIKAFCGFKEQTRVSEAIVSFAEEVEYLKIYTPTGVEASADAVVGTGFSVNVVVDGNVTVSYKLSVRGDLDGDGLISGSDQIMQRCALTGQAELGAVNALSADVDGDGSVSSADYLQLLSHVTGTAVLN